MFSIASKRSALRLFKKSSLDPSKLFVDFGFSRFLYLTYITFYCCFVAVAVGGGGWGGRGGIFDNQRCRFAA